jgi:hypothetical protein
VKFSACVVAFVVALSPWLRPAGIGIKFCGVLARGRLKRACQSDLRRCLIIVIIIVTGIYFKLQLG